MKKTLVILFILSFIIGLEQCEKTIEFPETPSIEYKAFRFYSDTDALGNVYLVGQLEFDFKDGDGDIGLNQPDTSITADSMKYNLFLSLYDYQEGVFVKIEELDALQYRMPFIEQQGQTQFLEGTVTVDLEYKVINYDTIFYTFYIMDRAYNRSNTDTTDILVFPKSRV